jgi:eukaryotic-like serine/threonine-protein kinase
VAFDQRGAVFVVEPDVEIRALTEGWKVAYGLAWSPKGNEVWFGAAKVGFAEQVYGVDLSGRVRLVAAFPGGVRLLDVSRSGRVLVTRDNVRFQISGRLAGSAQEQDLSWFDNSMAVDLSADGRTLLFREAGEGGGTSVATYLRRIGDAQAIRLGEGYPQALSPDGKWALVARPGTGGAKLVLLPTGAGQPKSLDTPPLDELGGVTFFPDSRRIAIFRKTGNTFRGYVLSLEAGKIEPLTPEGYRGGPVSPDGKWILLRKLESGKWFVFPIAGGEPRPLSGLDDVVETPSLATYPSSVQWSADSRALFAHLHSRADTKVFRIDVETGRRDPWLTIVPPDPAGIAGSPEPILTPDGKSYVYSYIRDLNDLYLAEGLR